MNPNTTIRPWLLACGKQYGINEAFYIRWPDESTRPETMFFTYKLESTQRQDGPDTIDINEGSGYSATYKSIQPFITRVRVDLYNSEDGLYELASCCAALSGIDILIRAMRDKGLALYDIVSIDDDTVADDFEINHHQFAVIDFVENVEIDLTFENEVVEEILYNLIINGAE